MDTTSALADASSPGSAASAAPPSACPVDHALLRAVLPGCPVDHGGTRPAPTRSRADEVVRAVGDAVNDIG